MRRRWVAVLVLVAGCQLDDVSDDGSFGHELRPSQPSDPPAPASFAEACQWPTSVVLGDGGCSGVLIHPSVVMTAGHCIGEGDGPAEIRFGEDAHAPALSVATIVCARHPDSNGVSKNDYAYCVLAEPVGLAIVPPALGCELDWLEVGQALVTVGSGNHGSSDGTKRVFAAELLGWHEGMIGASLGSEQLCPGDSGGPTFVRLPDGTWRVVGVSSGGPSESGDCIAPVLIAPTSEAVAWIEQQSGIDVSPCHLADGTWAPGPDCTGFALDPTPATGLHEWVDGTCVDPRTGPLASCGPSFGATEEHQPPTVAITSPGSESHYPNAPARLDVSIDAHDGEGVAVLEIELLVDGEVVALETIEHPFEQPSSWTFEGIELTAGVHELGATATDYWGNVGAAEPISILVGDEPSGNGSTGDEPSESACTVRPRRPGFGESSVLLTLTLLAARRRRDQLFRPPRHPIRTRRYYVDDGQELESPRFRRRALTLCRRGRLR